MLSPGWYVATTGQDGGLVSGVPVNSIDSWDVRRLGWLKHGHRRAQGQYVSHDLGQLAHLWSPTVVSCVEPGRVRGVFTGGVVIDRTELGGRDVKVEHPFISRVRVWQRHVEVEHSHSPSLQITCQHSNQVDVTVTQSQSFLHNFSGILYQVNTYAPSSLIGISN